MTSAKTTALCWLGGSILFFTMGEYLSKKYSLNPTGTRAIATIAIYMMGTICWLPSIRAMQNLTVLGTLWTLLGMTSTILVGMVGFKETITTTQGIGIGLALIAAVLLSL